MNRKFYGLTFVGDTGRVGVGVLEFVNGEVVGVDNGGVLNDGTYAIAGGQLRLDLRATVPPGVALVTGVPAQQTERSFAIHVSMPMDDAEMPLTIQTPAGVVKAC